MWASLTLVNVPAEKPNDVQLNLFTLEKPLDSRYHDRDDLRGLHDTLQAPKGNFYKSKLKIKVHIWVHKHFSTYTKLNPTMESNATVYTITP